MSIVRSANLARRLFSVNKTFFQSILLRNNSSSNSTPPSTKAVDTKKMEEKFKTNPYFSKYESKLKALYNENPEGFLNTLKHVKPEKVGDYKPNSDDIKNSEMAESLLRKKVNINHAVFFVLIENLIRLNFEEIGFNNKNRNA
jgi:hypothetical protein